MKKLIIVMLIIIALLFAFVPLLFAQETNQASALDKKVRAFLDSHRGTVARYERSGSRRQAAPRHHHQEQVYEGT